MYERNRRLDRLPYNVHKEIEMVAQPWRIPDPCWHDPFDPYEEGPAGLDILSLSRLAESGPRFPKPRHIYEHLGRERPKGAGSCQQHIDPMAESRHGVGRGFEQSGRTERARALS